MAADTTDRALKPLTAPCWYQRLVSAFSGLPRVNAETIPKFPEEPKFGMVPPSTPDRLLFGRDLYVSPRCAAS